MSVFAKINSIFELLARHYRKGLSASEIASELRLPRSSCYRLLADLKKHNYITYNRSKGTYFLGYTHLRFAEYVQEGMDEATVCLPYLEELHALTEETTFFAHFGGNICVDVAVCGFTNTSVAIGRGQELPLHATAVGKVSLAYLPRKTRSKTLDQLALTPLSPATITDRETLLEQLEEIRGRGYALSLGEMNQGFNALATPVFGTNGRVIGGISLVGTESSLPEEALIGFSEDFIDASIDISATFGGKYPDLP